METLKIVELFSGIGAQTQALKNLGINHTSICCEVDKKIHGIYEAIHGSTPNLGDITKVLDLPDCDLLTYSFPCQDISKIGNQKGLTKGDGTRSGLLWEVERLLLKKSKEKKLPSVLLLENVKQLVSPKNVENFNIWLSFLESIGYTNTWKILNSKDFGIPQNRERIFVVSIIGNKAYKFPSCKLPLVNLCDIMQSEKDAINEFGEEIIGSNEVMLNKIFRTVNNTQTTNSTNRIYGRNSIIHSLTTMASHPANFGAVLYDEKLNCNKEFRKYVKGENINKWRNLVNHIRLATPRDHFRLMGFNDTQFELAKNNLLKNNRAVSNLYHVAGNSIVINVLEKIFYELQCQKFI